MESKIPEATQAPHPFSWLYPTFALLVALAIGWSIFWFVQSRMAAGALANWMAHEAQLGRAWSCPDQKIGGFPFSLEISCSNPLFQGEVFGKNLTGSVRSLHASAPLLRTGDVIMQLNPPLAAKTSDGALDVRMQWGQLALELEIVSGSLDRISLSGSQVRLLGKAAGGDAGPTAFDEFNSYFVRSATRHDRAYDLMVSFNQGFVPPLNKFLDTQLPIAMHIDSTVSQVDLSGGRSLQDALEKWRADNGRVDVTTAWLTSGSMIFDAKGSLSLDDEHRATGKLDASFGGLEKAFSHLGIDTGLLRADQTLAGVLSAGTGRVELPVTFSDGYLTIGGARTNVQALPLY